MEIRTINVRLTPDRFEEMILIKGDLTWEEFFIKLIEERKETIKICEEAINGKL